MNSLDNTKQGVLRIFVITFYTGTKNNNETSDLMQPSMIYEFILPVGVHSVAESLLA